MAKNVHLALIQMSCSPNPQENQQKAEERIRQAASTGAQIICLQELYRSEYFCQHFDEQYFDLAEDMSGETTQRLSDLAAELGVVIIASLFEKRTEGIYHNTAVVLDADGKNLGIYRKAHIPDDPMFYEKYYFTPGDTGYKVFDTRFGRIGVLICWDQWYPEAARLTALQGAKILFYPTAIGTLPNEGAEEREEFMQAWQTIQRSHAVANGCYVASVNRVGTEGELTFWGDSFICGPFGKVLAKAGDGEEILSADVDLEAVEKQRRTWPYFRDRRIDTYGDLTKRYID
ncbi:MAG: carbon-nitrogen hydrolase [Bacteroidetes bacterium]|nr:carbon-nitrogen hydrolase [Bacteroidota bacterium]MCH8525125.1 carbon-nitrogen hydrolase [Balneolales bacterium]